MLEQFGRHCCKALGHHYNLIALYVKNRIKRFGVILDGIQREQRNNDPSCVMVVYVGLNIEQITSSVWISIDGKLRDQKLLYLARGKPFSST